MANRIMKRNVPSEAKIKCIRCSKQMKFRELRKHLAKVHNILNVSISCSKTLENRDTCDFHCSFSLDCFLEHSKCFHNNLFEEGANSIFDFPSGFNLLVSTTTGRIHTEVCQNAREKRRKEKMREAKVKWSMKQVTAKRKAKNTHATVSDNGDIVDPVEDASKVTTVTETDEVEVVCDPVLTTEPVMKKRKVKLAERVVSASKVSKNLKHKGKGKRCKPADVVTTNQQVATIATTHHPEIILLMNMPPAVIHPKILEDPVDVVTIEDSDDEDVDIAGIQGFLNLDMDSDDDDDIDGIQGFLNLDMDSDDDDDIDGIQGFLNLDMEEDDADAVEIDPESIHKRAYNLKDAVEWMNVNEGEIGFQRIFYELGEGDIKLGERLVLERVMAETNISAREHTSLLINWQMEKMKGVGSFDKNME
jgi:hypothetical protein